MYYQNEIAYKRKLWVVYLATFSVGEGRIIDKEDRSKIASSISTNFHHLGLAKFAIKTNKLTKETILTRIS